MPTPPAGLMPMRDFDPFQPAILHDAISDSLVTWDWERAEEFRRGAAYDEHGRVVWNGKVFDGWDDVLGG